MVVIRGLRSSKVILTALVLLLTSSAFLRYAFTALSSPNLDYTFVSNNNLTALPFDDGVSVLSNDTTATSASAITSRPTSATSTSQSAGSISQPTNDTIEVRESPEPLARKESASEGKNHDITRTSNHLPVPLDEDAMAQILRNSSIIFIQNLSTAQPRRSQLQLADVNTAFLADLRIFHFQLNYNYDPTLSNCNRIPYRKMSMGGCFGLGTQVGRFNRKMLRRIKQSRTVFGDIDTFTCGWFERDRTKDCKTMFGDCYFPALTTRGQVVSVNRTAITETTAKTCHDIKWFGYRYGEEALYAAHFSWLLGDDPPSEDDQVAVAPPQPCIALHIRRGDACINADRQCFAYDTYYRAVQFFVQRYPHLQRLVVLTDGDDFPLEKFQALVSTIDYPTNVNRSKYNVQHLRNASFQSWAPELRHLDNATSELLDEVAQASHCTALVGTLTAGISKWIWLLHMTRQGRVPLFYSLQGCTRNAWESGDYFDDGCEGPLFS